MTTRWQERRYAEFESDPWYTEYRDASPEWMMTVTTSPIFWRDVEHLMRSTRSEYPTGHIGRAPSWDTAAEMAYLYATNGREYKP